MRSQVENMGLRLSQTRGSSPHKKGLLLSFVLRGSYPLFKASCYVSYLLKGVRGSYPCVKAVVLCFLSFFLRPFQRVSYPFCYGLFLCFLSLFKAFFRVGAMLFVKAFFVCPILVQGLF